MPVLILIPLIERFIIRKSYHHANHKNYGTDNFKTFTSEKGTGFGRENTFANSKKTFFLKKLKGFRTKRTLVDDKKTLVTRNFTGFLSKRTSTNANYKGIGYKNTFENCKKTASYKKTEHFRIRFSIFLSESRIFWIK